MPRPSLNIHTSNAVFRASQLARSKIVLSPTVISNEGSFPLGQPGIVMRGLYRNANRADVECEKG